ncbi:L-aspartate oxidase [Hyphomonas sp. WL0036]|uniref:L-aspartate oxidase n=1 Tax=Hyphomonas sediminis TaxID=2866160 RepID=UPI001C81BA6E|nr:L-aspartate oxidase [Hyphomonas sediminis]MBY9065347.1 L-aspartate oxidase [Hyphomonas sediminis]
MFSGADNRLPAGAGAVTDVLIVGAGLAGLFLALKLAPRPCVVVSPAPLGQASSSAWAQGGLAAALHPLDSPAQHADDTVAAGAGLVDPLVARLIAEEGPARVRDLITLGVPFDRTPDGQLALSLEAAHSHPRVARVSGDLAGKAIMDALVAAVAAADHIELIEGARAESLLQDRNGRIAGVVLRGTTGRPYVKTARETVMCTGGSGGLYRVTTNPKEAQGEAIAMARRAGALMADLEFVQFHPTGIDIGRDPAPLATEALRGEGATLHNSDGRAFMADYHPLAELAPRDEVARAIHAERAAGRGAFLDCTKAVGEAFPHHFPTVFGACMSARIDPRTQMIPVAPAAHYHMGGIVADLWGKSTLEGLSVCGECSATGAHGANRLASNSLLEAVVFAERIARRLRDADLAEAGASEGYTTPRLAEADMLSLREAMSRECGVVRNAAGLTALLDLIERLETAAPGAAALTAARLIASGALARTESRGGHFRSDYPETGAPERQFLLPPAREALVI